MNPIQHKLLIAAVAIISSLTTPLAAQQPTENNSPEQGPADTSPDQDEILAYRFRLSAADAGNNLIVTNGSDRRAMFYWLRVDSSKQREAQADTTAWLEPGQSAVVTAEQADWQNLPMFYLAASRRLRVELQSAAAPEPLPIQPGEEETVLDVASLERYTEMTGGASCHLRLAGDTDSPPQRVQELADWHRVITALVARPQSARKASLVLARCDVQ